MSQSRFLQEEYSKKYRQAANNAAINSAITSLQSAGVNITYDAIMKRVSRASVEDIITEIRSTNTSTEVSSLSSPREQADDDSLTSEKMAETTLHNDHSLGTPELKSGVGGRPKGSTKAKKKKDY
jgi:hypothetical protein